MHLFAVVICDILQGTATAMHLALIGKRKQALRLYLHLFGLGLHSPPVAMIVRIAASTSD